MAWVCHLSLEKLCLRLQGRWFFLTLNLLLQIRGKTSFVPVWHMDKNEVRTIFSVLIVNSQNPALALHHADVA